MSDGPQCQTANQKAARGMPWSLSVQVGDIIKRTLVGRNQRCTALVVERFNAILFWGVWNHSGEREQVNSEYFEVVSAAG